MTPEDCHELCRLLARHELDDGFCWLPNGDSVVLLLNCNDLWAWACAEAQEVTAADIPAMDQAIADCATALGEKDYLANIDGPLLWACRKRKLRPQTPYYESIPVSLHSLFDAVGPERTKESMG